jgi:hypothetical protein
MSDERSERRAIFGYEVDDAYPPINGPHDAAMLRREEARRTAALADLPDTLSDEDAEQYDREWDEWLEAMAS